MVLIPDDELIYIGEVVNNMKYKRNSDNEIDFENRVFNKVGEGNQFIVNIEFGDKNEVEGRCVFEDYENENNVISLGVLTEKNARADVLAEIIDLEDIKIS